MAFGKIAGAEPSTVTFELRTVTQDINSTIQHQEVVTLGGSESSLAIAQVRATAPASTEFGLVVRVAEPSTGPFVISSIVGPVTVRSSAANALVSVYQSTAADLNVTVAGYVAPSTLQTVRQSTYTDLNGLMRLADRDNSTATAAIVNAEQPASTAYGLVVRIPAPITDSTNHAIRVNVVAGAAGGSTQVTVSQLLDSSGGSVSAADSANNAIRVNVVAGAAAGSTIVTVSTGSVRVHQSSAADLNVTVAGYSTTVNVSSVAGAVITRSSKADMLVTAYQSSAADFNVTVAGYSTTAQVSSLAGRVAIAGFHAVSGIVNVTDSTNNAINVNVVAGAAGGSTVVTVNGNASSNSSLYLPVRITNGTAFTSLSQDYIDGSTASNIAGPAILFDNGSNATMRAVSLTNGFPVNVVAGAAGGSTIVTISTGHVTVDTGSIRVVQSSASELVVTLGAIAAAFQSTTAPAPGSSALIVRQALQDLLSTRAVITSSNSTALYTLVSSAAALKHKVYAYSITSTETTPSTIVFMSSNVIDRWAVAIGSGSSGVTGANLAMSPPGYIFRTDAANALRCLIEKGASTQCIVSVSIAYFSEP